MAFPDFITPIMKQAYMILSFFTAIAIFFVFIAYSFVNMQLDSQKSRNSYIERENKKLDEDIQKIANLQAEINNTLDKRKVVESLQVNRVDAVNILHEGSITLQMQSSRRSFVYCKLLLN